MQPSQDIFNNKDLHFRRQVKAQNQAHKKGGIYAVPMKA